MNWEYWVLWHIKSHCCVKRRIGGERGRINATSNEHNKLLVILYFVSFFLRQFYSTNIKFFSWIFGSYSHRKNVFFMSSARVSHFIAYFEVFSTKMVENGLPVFRSILKNPKKMTTQRKKTEIIIMLSKL